MIDVASLALERGRFMIEMNLQRQVAKGTINAADRAAALSRITTATDASVVSDSDLVIEAATEDLN